MEIGLSIKANKLPSDFNNDDNKFLSNNGPNIMPRIIGEIG